MSVALYILIGNGSNGRDHSGALRISPMHTDPHCQHLHRPDSNNFHNQIVKLGWREIRYFTRLGLRRCRTCS
jgi:hypothetical protein